MIFITKCVSYRIEIGRQEYWLDFYSHGAAVCISQSLRDLRWICRHGYWTHFFLARHFITLKEIITRNIQMLLTCVIQSREKEHDPWWRHQMETFSALLALCAGNSPVTGEFPPQRPVTRSFDVSFDLRLNKRLSKQSWGWRFETPSWSL